MTTRYGGLSRSHPTGQAPSGLDASRFDRGRGADPMAITHRSWSPRYQSAPYRQHPGRREHIHGPVQPMDVQTNESRWLLWGALAALAVLAPQIWGAWL